MIKIGVGSAGNLEISDLTDPIILKNEKSKVMINFCDNTVEIGVWKEEKDGTKGWDWHKASDGNLRWMDYKIIDY